MLPFVSAAATKGSAVRPPTPEDVGELLVGKPLPPFSMKLVGGGTINQEQTKGRVILLGFWASWCVPCDAATRAFENLHRRFGAKGLAVIGANGLEEGPDGKTAALLRHKELGSTFTTTYDNDQLMSAWGIEGVPFVLLVDRDGVVRYANGRWLPESERILAANIATLLAER